jgi:hypothetical protein
MNTGSFGGPIGGAQLIKSAMQARGTPGGSPLAQLSPSAPGFNPANAAQPPLPPSQGSPMGAPPQGAPPPPAMGPGGVPLAPVPPGGVPIESPQEKLIITALTKQLERLHARQQQAVMPPGAIPPQSPVPQAPMAGQGSMI